MNGFFFSDGKWKLSWVIAWIFSLEFFQLDYEEWSFYGS